MGTIFMEMRYTPFKAAGKAAADNTPGAQKSNMTLGLSKKNLTSDHKGVLTVTLIRCIDLEVSLLLARHYIMVVTHKPLQLYICCLPSYIGFVATRASNVPANKPPLPQLYNSFLFVHAVCTRLLIIVIEIKGDWQVCSLNYCAALVHVPMIG